MNIDRYQDWSKQHPTAAVAHVLHNKDRIKVIAVDTETFYSEEMYALGGITRFVGKEKNKNNTPFGVSLYYELDGLAYGFWFDYALLELKPLLEDPTILKVFHNVKYDLHMLANIGINPRKGLADTSIMIQDIDEEFMCKMPSGKLRRSKKLKDLGYHFVTIDAHEGEKELAKLKRTVSKYTGTTPNRVSYLGLYKADHDAMVRYAIFDTELTYKLYHKLLRFIQEQELEKVIELDLEATLSLFEMERTGVKLNMEKLERDTEKVTALMNACVEEMYNTAGMKFNQDATSHLVNVFLLIGAGKWRWFTENGAPQLTQPVLEFLRDKADEPSVRSFARLVLDYKTLKKILDTYLVNFKEYAQHGRIHCSYNIAPDERGNGGTKTGRTSSSHPNMQNIPKYPIELPDGSSLKMREYFIPTNEDYMFFAMDADQEEYRLLAHYGKDENFMEFIRKGKDVHASTAAMMFGTTYENALLDKSLRQKGKTTNFALVYGLGVASMTNVLFEDFDEDLYKTAQKYLFDKEMVYNLPPYSDKHRVTDYIEDNMPETLKQAIRYFFFPKTCAMLQEAIDTKTQYFKIFPGIKEFTDSASKVGAQRGWVKTWYGRRRRFKNPAREGYKAPNSIIQGGCGDILKLKLWELRDYLADKKTRMVLQTHDEILFEVHRSEAQHVATINKKLQELDFRVPITWGTEASLVSWGAVTENYKDVFAEWRAVYGKIEVEE